MDSWQELIGNIMLILIEILSIAVIDGFCITIFYLYNLQ